jgi:hypothetical protein
MYAQSQIHHQTTNTQLPENISTHHWPFQTKQLQQQPQPLPKKQPQQYTPPSPFINTILSIASKHDTMIHDTTVCPAPFGFAHHRPVYHRLVSLSPRPPLPHTSWPRPRLSRSSLPTIAPPLTSNTATFIVVPSNMVTLPTFTHAKQCFQTTQPSVFSFLFTVAEKGKQHGEKRETEIRLKPKAQEKKVQEIKKQLHGPHPTTRSSVTPF